MSETRKALVIDMGSSSIRCATVDEQGHLGPIRSEPLVARSPAPGLVELDPEHIVSTVLRLAREVIASSPGVQCVGIANQRATTVVWDSRDGVSLGPAIGWQDLRTVGTCLELQGRGLRLAPNASATKIMWLLEQINPAEHPLEYLRFGTLDTWIAWHLSDGAAHITDLTNAGVTGLIDVATRNWDEAIITALDLPSSLFGKVVDSSGLLASASALPGSPAITGIVGDQQASLLGQSCVHRGDAKLTLGTGAMLDLVLGEDAPAEAKRSAGGTFPIPTWQSEGRTLWGLEAIALSAGSCVDWLRDDLAFFSEAKDSETLASSVASSEGVVFVPALMGLGTPLWDFGARGLLMGITMGSSKAHITRAVLEGIAQRCRDLVDAAEQDGGVAITHLRLDGGMTENTLLVSLLADAIERPLEVSPVREATVLGAGYAAGFGSGMFADLSHISMLWRPTTTVESTLDPFFRDLAREAYLEARGRAERSIPGLSDIDF